jgi:tetratricopeptide (TPR) repeat protein
MVEASDGAVGLQRKFRSALTRPSVLRRFILMMAAATFAMFTLWAVVREIVVAPPGDYEVRQGDILLTDGKYSEAIERFDAALAVSPGHRGAMMGRAIALLQSDRIDEAERAFGELIAFLSGRLAADDPTGRAVLAGAYANRGILYDRTERYAAALSDYRQALAIDAGAVDGPGLLHKIVFGEAQPATIRKRADYLERQLALPEDQRLLRVPDIDARQRMYKP